MDRDRRLSKAPWPASLPYLSEEIRQNKKAHLRQVEGKECQGCPLTAMHALWCANTHICVDYTHMNTHTRERENSENRYMIVLTSRQNSVKSVSLRNDSKDLSVGVSTHPHEATMALGALALLLPLL